MKVTVVIAHPNPQSFNHALAGAVVAELSCLGHQVNLHDLHAEKFDPILPLEEISPKAALSETLQAQSREVAEADGLVVVHPNWWGQPPAILKGWLDRVLRPGVAYKFAAGPNGEGMVVGLLRARTALVFTTANTPPEQEQRLYGDPLDGLWKRCVWGFCGVKNVHRELIAPIISSTLEQRQGWLERARALVRQHLAS